MIFAIWVVLSICCPALWATAAEHHAGHGGHPSGFPDHHKLRGKISMLPSDCSPEEMWDVVTAMCFPLPTQVPLTHLMLHGNVFLARVIQSGPRGEDASASPNMAMANLGHTFGGRHFLNLGLMLTGEKWTFPERGYPLILQTGESNNDGVPFVDAQHPHSSPIMGLTLSDTLRVGAGRDFFRFAFSPRGQSTDGPIVFMHRPTGVVNPDVPLGHHVGQDVGHVSSTVIAATTRIGNSQLELSGFNGTEPEPDKVDLPIATPNSAAARYTHFFSERLFAMASVAYVDDPEEHTNSVSFYSDVTHLMRYSASAYTQRSVFAGSKLFQTLIYGAVKTFGVDTFRHSLLYEFSLQEKRHGVWGRAEAVQRTPSELLISGLPRPNDGRWTAAFTLGVSETLVDFGTIRLQIGVSGTKTLLPGDFLGSYGGNPWSGKIFIQLSGMDMWSW